MYQWFKRKFRNAPNDMLSESTFVEGQFAEHLGDWCPGELSGGLFDFDPRDNPEATLVTSMVEPPLKSYHSSEERGVVREYYPEGHWHAPVLDLDIEHVYYPSTTPGHAALLLNVNLTWENYVRLLNLLEELGIIQHGFAEASRQRGYSACRTPWTKKPPVSD